MVKQETRSQDESRGEWNLKGTLNLVLAPLLYHVEPQVIAPVIYMWRPSKLPKRRDEEEVGDCIGNDGPVPSVDLRKLWVWIHASSFSEGYASLKLACQKQMNETGVLADCLSLEGQLAKLEIFGAKAFHLLQKTLHHVTSSESPPSILPQFVMDPRLIPNNSFDDSTVSVEMTKTEITTSKEAETFKCLWDANSELSPPEDENILCWEKHQSRMKSFCIDDPADEFPMISSRPRSSRSCPLLLLKHKKHGDAATGWSLILPLSWVKVFWNNFVSKGAQAIGQREKRWVSCDAGLPLFPSDFPDCKAYSSLTMSEAADLEEKAQKRPLLAVTPSRIPIPPPWMLSRVVSQRVPIKCLQVIGVVKCKISNHLLFFFFFYLKHYHFNSLYTTGVNIDMLLIQASVALFLSDITEHEVLSK